MCECVCMYLCVCVCVCVCVCLCVLVFIPVARTVLRICGEFCSVLMLGMVVFAQLVWLVEHVFCMFPLEM